MTDLDPQTAVVPPPDRFARAWHILVEGLVNILAPYLVYIELDPRWGDLKALLASMAPPALWSLYQLHRARKLDPISLFVLLGIGLSVVAAIGGGSPRFLQLRENLVTLAIGLTFLGSAAIGKPLIYQLALAGQRRKGAEEAQKFADLQQYSSFRRAMLLTTLVWGVAMVGIFALNVGLIYMLSIPTYLLAGPIVSYALIATVAGWNVLYVRRLKRRRAASPPPIATPG